MNQTIGAMHAITSEVVDVFKALAVGSRISYAELEATIGGDPRQPPNIGYCRTARRYVLREYRIIIEVERGVGFIRVDGAEAIQVCQSNLRSVARKARRTRQKTHAIDYAKLSREDQVKHNILAGTAGAVNLMASNRGQRKALQRINSGQIAGEVNIGETLKLFQKDC